MTRARRPSSRTLRECLDATGLEGDCAAAFARARQRIAVHHRQWRVGFPAYAALLDDDAQRAQALAGSYAAQGRDTLEAWVDARLDQADGRLPPGRLPELQAWLERYADAWKTAVLDEVDLDSWDDRSRDRFGRVLDDVVEAGRVAAAARLDQAAAPSAHRWGNLPSRVLRPLYVIGRALRSIFRPDAGAGHG